MQQITDYEQLEHSKTEGGLLILFGSTHCGVCQTIKPQLSQLIEQQFPQIETVYIDCEQSPDICAQHSIFSLPVVQTYIEGLKVAEFGKSFSLKQLEQAIERPYKLWLSK